MEKTNLKLELEEVIKIFEQNTWLNPDTSKVDPPALEEINELAIQTFYALNSIKNILLKYLD